MTHTRRWEITTKRFVAAKYKGLRQLWSWVTENGGWDCGLLNWLRVDCKFCEPGNDSSVSKQGQFLKHKFINEKCAPCNLSVLVPKDCCWGTRNNFKLRYGIDVAFTSKKTNNTGISSDVLFYVFCHTNKFSEKFQGNSFRIAIKTDIR